MKKNNTLLISFLIFTLLSGLYAGDEKYTLNLLPMPEKTMVLEGRFRLGPSFVVNILGEREKFLSDGVLRILKRLTERTGLFLVNPNPLINDKSDSAGMTITAKRAGKLELGEDESYKIVISPESVSLSAETDIGVLRGLTTASRALCRTEVEVPEW